MQLREPSLLYRGPVPDAVWFYALFHARLDGGGHGTVEALSIPSPRFYLFYWHDGNTLNMTGTVKYWCIIHQEHPFCLFTHSLLIRERLKAGDVGWRALAMPFVAQDVWRRRIEEDLRRIRACRHALELGATMAELQVTRY